MDDTLFDLSQLIRQVFKRGKGIDLQIIATSLHAQGWSCGDLRVAFKEAGCSVSSRVGQVQWLWISFGPEECRRDLMKKTDQSMARVERQVGETEYFFASLSWSMEGIGGGVTVE